MLLQNGNTYITLIFTEKLESYVVIIL